MNPETPLVPFSDDEVEDLKRRKARAREAGRQWRAENPHLVETGFRRCSTCAAVGRGSDMFMPDSRAAGGYRNQCRDCHSESTRKTRARNRERVNERQRMFRANNPEHVASVRKAWRERQKQLDPEKLRNERRARLLKRKYGLSTAAYDHMLASQGGVCATCGGPPSGKWGRFVVDHSHASGKVRGLLCNGCNRAIGFIDDSPDTALRIHSYLKEHE